jgi:DNA mismatch repair ATPase MutS
MDIDQTTYEDLSIFNRIEEFSVFQKFDFTVSVGGRHWLQHYFNNPFSDLKHIRETQKIISLLIQNADHWPGSISNGTVMVMERFYESALDKMPDSHDLVNSAMYKLLHGPDFALTRYSIGHFADFFQGMQELIEQFDIDDAPMLMRSYLQRAKGLMNHEVIIAMRKKDKTSKFSMSQVVYYGNFIKYRYKNSAQELIEIFGRLDAWHSMAKATVHHNLALPTWIDQADPCVEARGLYHILLPKPTAYDVQFNKDGSFLFLTGANMAGKSTFIKAVGIAVYLAHLGLGVPAMDMRLSLFDGILSNINVVDNIAKGESYFYNEVQRIRDTLIKINDHRKWLVLIDELFKGTNVQDAMKCSSTVIKGLIKIRNSIFILSTHLYEIGEELKQYPSIIFKYFETSVKDDQLEFSYQLREGISNDRLGYLILKREKVVEMLEKL